MGGSFGGSTIQLPPCHPRRAGRGRAARPGPSERPCGREGAAMPTRTVVPVGAPIWVLLQTTDEARARSFYGRVFGWEGSPADPAHGGYFEFSLAGDRVAGCSEHDAIEPQADTWVTYFASSDAATTVTAAAAAGSTVLTGPMEVNVQGTMAVVTDPGGNVVGRLGAERAPRLPALRRARHAGVVRPRDAWVRRGGGVLPRRARLDPGRRRATPTSSATRPCRWATSSWPGSWTAAGTSRATR